MMIPLGICFPEHSSIVPTAQDLGEIQAGYNWNSAQHAVNAIHSNTNSSTITRGGDLEGGGRGGVAKGGMGSHSLSNAGSRISTNKGRNVAAVT